MKIFKKAQNNNTKKILALLIILTIFFFALKIYSQKNTNQTMFLTSNGEIIRYFKSNLFGEQTEELACIYKNILTKKLGIAIFSLENGNIKKIFDIEIDKSYLFFSLARLEKGSIHSILLFNEDEVSIVKLLDGNYRIDKYLNIKNLALGYQFSNDFPYLEISHDINSDGIDELFILTKNAIEIYQNGKITQSYPYQIQAFYNYKSSFGGFSSSQNILMIFPDILLKDINNDGFKDLILKYRAKIEFSFFNNITNQFLKGKTIDLTKYVSVRSGYSFFNEHIRILNFNDDKYPDIVIFNFNMASVFNADKTGILCYLFKGNKEGWQNSPSNQFFMEDLSGLESKLVFTDFNKDNYIDLVNIGSKLFSSNFLLSLSMKRSIPIFISFYPQTKDSFSKTPILQIEKGISLDNQNVLDSSQLSFDFYTTLDLAGIISEIIVGYDTDFNDDSINDIIIYNFDGTFSIFISNTSNNTIFQKKETLLLPVSNDFLEVYYLSGPYNLVIKDKSKFYLINIIKRQGKIFFSLINL